MKISVAQQQSVKHSDQQADGQFRPACVQHKSHSPYDRQLCSSERPNHVDVLFDLTVVKRLVFANAKKQTLKMC